LLIRILCIYKNLALCNPIIVYASPWKDDLPDWVKPQITLERLVMNMKAMHEEGVPVGDTEVLAYIFPWPCVPGAWAYYQRS
jgi:hypothetical protein